MPLAMNEVETSTRRSVLVVDDEPTIGDIVSRYLRRGGFDTRIAYDGPQALAMSAERTPDLVILDIMLPGCDGLEVMRRLHETDEDAPAVILLTAKGQESDRIIGLLRGADDYVVKPFSPNELVARAEAVLRRGSLRRSSEVIEAGELRIDASRRTVHVGAREVRLTQREFDLLAFLAREPGRVFSRDQLMERVWELAYYSDSSTVTVHIRRLRAKIEAEPERPRHIQTVWGRGYRFSA
jgi:two-component system, OmpR family, response regulator ResD